MSEIVIFGAGEWGKYAKTYYENVGSILCFVDNNESLWGNERYGLKIEPPDILRQLAKNVTVVIANMRHSLEIRKQIVEEYGIEKIITFRISIDTEVEYFEKPVIEDNGEDELIVSYVGGLGNQMFLYALSRYLAHEGRNVTADFSFYVDPWSVSHGAIIKDVFKDISLKICNPERRLLYHHADNSRFIFCEKEVDNGSRKLLEQVIKYEKGIIQGYFQVADIVESVSEELYHDFCFEEKPGMQGVLEKIDNHFSISVHIRRGDYLNPLNENLNICDKAYFERAMDYMRGVVSDPFWVFFSDDIEWVRQTFPFDNAMYISGHEISNYEDWYDMFFMSKCTHHIMSNSTFSWWGAWLDHNPNKIVIAPVKWTRRGGFPDICPKEWIRM